MLLSFAAREVSRSERGRRRAPREPAANARRIRRLRSASSEAGEDVAQGASESRISLGQAEALRGQGPPVGWNPYVVAAKFVVNTVESAADIKRLAKEPVDTILQNKTLVEEKAKAQAP